MTLAKRLEDIQFLLQDAKERAVFFGYSPIVVERLKLIQRALHSIQIQVNLEAKPETEDDYEGL